MRVRLVFLGAVELSLLCAAGLGPPDAEISIDSGQVSPGGSIIVGVDASGLPKLGGATIEVHYDPSVLDATNCTADPGGVFDAGFCNPTFDDDGIDSDIVRFNLVSASGVFGTSRLAEITFEAVGSGGDSSILDLVIPVLADTIGTPLPANGRDGEIILGSEASATSSRNGGAGKPLGGPRVWLLSVAGLAVAAGVGLGAWLAKGQRPSE